MTEAVKTLKSPSGDHDTKNAHTAQVEWQQGRPATNIRENRKRHEDAKRESQGVRREPQPTREVNGEVRRNHEAKKAGKCTRAGKPYHP